MTLIGPRAELAAHSSFIDYLVAAAGTGRLVRALAADAAESAPFADDFVHLLLGLASIGSAVEDLATPRWRQ
ncbi:hypothetical protein ACQI4F_01160 [Mycolicibacterium vaccae]|uniref:hypothetical protein n=1 Tax=Mycolicibacterium vaccae TaxID=1810 RepID=UPI003CFB704A